MKGKKKITLLVALDDEREKHFINKVLSEEEDEYDLLYPESVLTLDEILNSHKIDIILLDFHFQNGAIADWLSLWPIPHILFAHVSEKDQLREILKDEVSSFMIREPSYRYIETLPIVVKKILYFKDLKEIQNHHLRISENRYMDLVEALPDLVYHVDSQGKFLFVNDRVDLLGYDPVELTGKSFTRIVHPEDVERISKQIILPQYKGKKTGPENAPKLFDERRTGNRKTSNLVVRLKKKGSSSEKDGIYGSVISYGEVSSTGFLLKEKGHADLGTVGIIRDVTNQMLSQKLLEESLEEKTILLREIHHRVKNNLQLVLSLMNLHCAEIEGTKRMTVFKEIQSEIHSMALVHDQLYHSDLLSRINMKDYITALFERLCELYKVDTSKVKGNILVFDLSLKLEKATPVGLIINDLVSNILRNFSEKDGEGKVEIEFRNWNNGDFILNVSGTGMHKMKPFKLLREGTSQFKLVDLLVEQLKGRIDKKTSAETGTRIILPKESLFEN